MWDDGIYLGAKGDDRRDDCGQQGRSLKDEDGQNNDFARKMGMGKPGDNRRRAMADGRETR